MEHRHHPRARVLLPSLMFHQLGAIYPCTVENICTEGVFIRIEETLIPKGSLLRLEINALPYEQETFTIIGYVVHVMSNGIGVMCEEGILEKLVLLVRQPRVSLDLPNEFRSPA